MKARLIVFGAMALGPPAALAVSGTSRLSWIAIGAGVWAGSVVLKILLGNLVHRAISKLELRTQAALWGAWSAFCELGAVAFWFAAISNPSSVGDVIGVGVGAGSLEIIVIVGRGWLALQMPSKLLLPKAPGDWFVAWSGVFERISTSVGHVASRGLVWVGLKASILVPAAAVAFATFAVVDGLATYGHSKGWNWKDPGLCRRFNGFLAGVGALELALFASVLLLGLEA